MDRACSSERALENHSAYRCGVQVVTNGVSWTLPLGKLELGVQGHLWAVPGLMGRDRCLCVVKASSTTGSSRGRP